jgi:SAM-dependent methyltransferase
VTEQDLSGVADLYSRSLAEHGTVAKGVGWGDEPTHRLRFDKLAQVIEGDAAPTVNDLGCGFGSLWGYLDETGRRPARYYGYDISAEMLDEARRALPGEGVELIAESKLRTEADYSFASGIFNVRLETDEASWAEFVRDTLCDLHEHSTRGFAFNVLTSYVDYREEHLFYADPREWLDFCKTELSPRVALLHDYPLYEWTMLVRRP